VLVGVSADSKDGYYDLYPVGSIELTTGKHIIKTVFPKGGLTFNALEIISLNILESAPEETSNVITAPAPDTGDINNFIFIIFGFINIIFIFAGKRKNR